MNVMQLAGKRQSAVLHPHQTTPPPTSLSSQGQGARQNSAIVKDEKDEEMRAASRKIFIEDLGVIVGYLLLGTLIYHFAEGWGFIDALYFSTVTLTTVGYGDQESWSGDGIRLFTALYALVGIMLIGSALGVVGAQVVEEQDRALAKAKTLALQKQKDSSSRDLSATTDTEVGAGVNAKKENKTFYERNPSVKKLIPGISMLTICIIVGVLLAHFDDEDLSFIQCFYFAVITVTTIGYGDISPATEAGKLFGVFYVLFACATVAQVLGSIAGLYIDAQQEKARLAVLQKKIGLDDFKAFDVDGDGRIEKTEFVIRKMMLMGLVNQEDMSLCEAEFEVMDVDGSGEITLDDLGEFLKDNET